jgi:hypothetical protein
LARDAEPEETRRGLPGDPEETHSRDVEAAIGDGIDREKFPVKSGMHPASYYRPPRILPRPKSRKHGS